MQRNIVIRPFEDEDLNTLEAIQHLCFGSSGGLGELTSANRYVAEENDGTAGFMLTSEILNDRWDVVLTIAVHPEFRRCGIATQLLEAAQAAAVIQGKSIRAVTNLRNLAFVRLLRSVGFKSVSGDFGFLAFEWGRKRGSMV